MTTTKAKTYDDDLTDIQIFSQVKSYMFLAHPFYGSLLTKLKFVKVEAKNPQDPKFIPTCATDGKHFYYNMDFLRTLPVKERVFVFAHEIMHCITHSIGRGKKLEEIKEDFSHVLHNYATDYAINQILKEDRIGEVPEWCLQKDEYRGMISEQIYEILEEEQEKNPNSAPQISFNPETGRFEDQNGDSLVDVHLDEMSDEDKASMMDAIREAYQHAKLAGKMPGNTETLVQSLLEPKINWKKILQVSVQSIFKNDVSWAQPNRRSLDPRVITPSLNYFDVPDICIAIDTSGSISETDKQKFLSEIYGILKFYKSFKLKIWCFDTEAQGYAEYDQTDIKKLINYKMVGGGGTQIKCNFEFMKKNKIKPNQFVCFTDGYNWDDNWGDPKYCPTTWLIYENENPSVPFGKWVEYS